MAVTEEVVNPPAEYVGRVEAVQAVDLRARVEGYLEQVKFKEGGNIHAGDLLYLIEQAPYEAAVAEARAKVARAEASLRNARQYLERVRAVRAGAVSATDLDASVSAELEAKAQLQEEEANLKKAELDLGYTTIIAPINGRIGRTAYTQGNLVGPNSGRLARIVQLDPIRVVYSVSENDSMVTRMANAGSKQKERCRLVFRIRLPGGQMYPVEGRIDFVDNEVEPNTGTIAIRAVFDNEGGVLLPGQYVTVLVSCGEGRRLPVVSQSAVLQDREGRYVFVLDDQNRVQQRRITTGAALGTDWVVASGLVAGETIISQGVQKVRPGQTVKPVAGSM
jgi:membrane fusion protein (multidrug efflux system)